MKTPLILVSLAIAALIASGIRHELKQHHPAKLAWRWFTGQPYHGKTPCNSTWFRRATTVYHPSGRIHPWWQMPRIYRTWHRVSGTVFAGMLGFGLLKYRGITILSLEIAGGLALIIGAYIGIRKARAWHNDKVIVSPLAEGLSGILALPAQETQRAITLPPSALTKREGELGHVILPPHFRAAPNERGAVEHLISTRLPMDVDFVWHTRKSPLRVSIVASPKCPDFVGFQGLIPEMEACTKGTVVIGKDRKLATFTGSFKGDDPHWGASVGSGRGKSVWLQSVGAQILHNDREAMFVGIDPKQASFEPLIGVPGVRVANDPQNIPGMWELIREAKSEMMAKLDALNRDKTLEFPITLVALDELNTFAAMSSAWWRANKPKGEKDTPPIWFDIAFMLWMGRQVCTYLILVGQRLDERATGGLGLRDSLGFRAIAGYRPNQYRMLIGDGPIPRSQKPKGRWLYSDGQNETWIQNALGDVDPLENSAIMRDYAMAGRSHHGRTTIPLAGRDFGRARSGPERGPQSGQERGQADTPAPAA